MPFSALRLYQALKRFAPSIDSSVAGKNLLSCFEKNVQSHPQREVLFASKDKKYSEWKSINWHTYQETAQYVGSALLTLQVQKNEVVPMISRNRPEHNIADIGILYGGGIPSSLYPSLKSGQLVKILKLTQSTVIFVDHESILKEVLEAQKSLPKLQHIVTFSATKLESKDVSIMSWKSFLRLGKSHIDSHMGTITSRALKLSAQDIACILFTSGTTGEPKGVQITHENILWTIESYLNRTGIVSPKPRMISYLPMAHITERVAHHYHVITRLGQLYFALEVTDLKQVLPCAKPTLFFAVPRVWEKFHNAMLEKIRLSGKERLVHYAIDNGLRKLHCEQHGIRTPWHVRLQHKLFTHLIFNGMKSKLGLTETEIFGSGAAPLNPEVQRFFHAINVPITEVYGLTENTAPALSNYPSDKIAKFRDEVSKYGGNLPKNTNRIGSVGLPIPGTEAKINKDGELLLRGKHIFHSYYKNPKATQEAFTLDGWFKTGDIVKTCDNGMYQVIARKKELIVTSGGKNIAPVEIENLIKRDPLIGSICVIGDRHNYLIALITLNHEGGATAWLHKHKLPDMDLKTMANHPQVTQHIQSCIDKTNESLARVQQVKKFVILPCPWTPETGELTPTLKLKRFYITKKYSAIVDKLYNDNSSSNHAA